MGDRAGGGGGTVEDGEAGRSVLTADEPPACQGWRLVASVPEVADRFCIAGPPREKFAVQYAPAHFSSADGV